MNIILSTYLTKHNAFNQHDSTLGCKKDCFELIRKWYDSVVKLNLNAVIFHNELTDTFIQQLQNNFVTFVKWDFQNRPSYNDERYFIFENYIDRTSDIKNIFYTDIFDVIFYRNPFEMIREDTLCVGSEEMKSDSSYSWVNKKLKLLNLPTLKRPQTVFNAGICGGPRPVFLFLMREMIRIMTNLDKEVNSNMAVFNYCLHHVVKSKIITGYPLHNIFKSNKVKEGTYIKHK